MSEARNQLERFRAALTRCMGFAFDDSRLSELAGVMARRIEAGGNGAAAYLEAVESHVSRDELRALAEELTVGETYFFRNVDQLRAFAEVAPAGRRLRILSAGCASGEEAFSLAMLAREHSFEVSIRAVDLNPAALKKAARGRYSVWSLRETPVATRERWFQRDGRDWVLDPSIRAMVTFEERNLAVDDAELWPRGVYDVVFCRNVIMYFSSEVARAVVARIGRSLISGGLLFLGHAETLRGLSADFHLLHTHNTFYYQRRDRSEQLPPSSFEFPMPAPVAPDLTWIEVVQQSTDRIRTLAEQPPEKAPEKTPEKTPAKPVAAAAPPPVTVDLQHAVELLRQDRFHEALQQIAELPPHAARDPEALLLHAALLTHSGKLDSAEQACARLLEIDDLNAGSHYLLALCREGVGDQKGAAEHDQVAIYLDPAFVMPRLHVGLMARRVGDRATARRELTEALRLLPREDPSRLLLFGGGFSRQSLIALCEAELSSVGSSS